MDSNKNNILTIETPEGVKFNLRLAGPVIRCLAWMLDLLCIGGLAKILSTVTGIFFLISYELAVTIQIIAYFIISTGYGIIMEYYWRGQTIGKRVFKLKVMDSQGLYLKFHQVVMRNLLRFIDMLPMFYLVGGLACLTTRHSQRLGDIAADTIVIWNPGIPEPDLDQVHPDKYNSLHDHPHLKARLRQRVSSLEAGIALQALLRREQLDPEARIELFNKIAVYFKKVVEFPQEAIDGISDEQYIRNVVDVLYHTGSKRM
jgi:uncharacterized RDD family membrane protein YckC